MPQYLTPYQGTVMRRELLREGLVLNTGGMRNEYGGWSAYSGDFAHCRTRSGLTPEQLETIVYDEYQSFCKHRFSQLLRGRSVQYLTRLFRLYVGLSCPIVCGCYIHTPCITDFENGTGNALIKYHFVYKILLMSTHRKTAVIVGVLFLTATATFMIGDSMLVEPLLDDPDYLITVSENRTQMVLGVLIAFIDGIAIVGIAVFLFPVFKKHNEPMALGYVGFRVVEFAIIFVYLICPLLLIDLSQEYARAGAGDASHFQTSGALFLAVRYWTLQMIYIMNGILTLILSYVLYTSKLVPRFLSVLGLIGGGVLLPGALLDMFGHLDTLHGAGMLVFFPGGLFELILPIWLFVKGFNLSVVDSWKENGGR
jgi:hypothetical protein